MNVFDFINQYKKSNVSTYGDLLENKFNPENDLSGAEKAMYNQLKAENAPRYDTDIGKDFKTTSMLNPGAKAKAEHISHIINGINALNGKDSDGNIPTDKDDLKVYFWYSD